ncbi:MAG: hypothetical protein AAF211_29085 [Myxococcota bacterium]
MRPLVLVAAIIQPCSPLVIDVDEPVDWKIPLPLDALSDTFASCPPVAFVQPGPTSLACRDDDAAVVGDDRFTSVEAAVDAASDGDTVHVCPGTHRVRLRLSERRLAITSVSGDPADTFLSGGFASPVVTLDRGALTLSALTLRQGRASTSGGAIFASNGAVRLAGVRLDDNRTPVDGGAVMAVASSLLVQASAVVGNHAGGNGGGLAMVDGCAEVQFTAFDDNTSQGRGGGLSASGSSVSVISGRFDGNRAASVGGALQVEGPLEITGTGFTANLANERGGAVHVTADAVSIDGSTFIDNGAADAGGAIAALDVPALQLRDDAFTDNTASVGSAIDADTLQLVVEGGSFGGPPTGSLAPLRATRPDGFVSGVAVDFRDLGRDHVDTPCGRFVLGLDAAFTCDAGRWSVP